jgi:hypothetical protein
MKGVIQHIVLHQRQVRVATHNFFNIFHRAAVAATFIWTESLSSDYLRQHGTVRIIRAQGVAVAMVRFTTLSARASP